MSDATRARLAELMKEHEALEKKLEDERLAALKSQLEVVRCYVFYHHHEPAIYNRGNYGPTDTYYTACPSQIRTNKIYVPEDELPKISQDKIVFN